MVYTQISVLRNSDAKKRDTNGLLPYKFVWEEVPPILYGADTLLYDPLALFEGKGTFVYQVVNYSDAPNAPFKSWVSLQRQGRSRAQRK